MRGSPPSCSGIVSWIAGAFIERCGGAVQWWIGDWLNYGEGRPEWGEKYEQAIQAFDKEYGTLSDYKAVAKTFQFPRRHGNLSFKHHREVAYLDAPAADALLDQAEANDWSCAVLRKNAADKRARDLALRMTGLTPSDNLSLDRRLEGRHRLANC